MASGDSARCPMCRKVSQTPAQGRGVFYCHHCGMYFSNEDDGDVGRARPDVIVERREAFRIRQAQRRVRRN